MRHIIPTAAQLDRILFEASLAPSPHNVQGWRFRMDGAVLLVLADPQFRIMHELDPQQKEGAIALGAAIENLSLSAARFGLLAQVTYLSDNAHADVAASISFVDLPEGHPQIRRQLHKWLSARGMNRSRYRNQCIPQAQIVELQTIAREEGFTLHVLTDRNRIKALASMAGTAAQFKFTHEPTHRELYHYLRFSRADAARSRDGLPLEHFNIPAWLANIARIGMAWPILNICNKFGYHRALAYVQETFLIRSAPAVCLLCTPQGERVDYLRGGRVLQRLWLTASKYGIAVQPHSAIADLGYARVGGYHTSISPAWRQRIDAFPSQLSELFDIAGQPHLINLFRIGYATRTWETRSLRRKVTMETDTHTGYPTDAERYYQTLIERNPPFITRTDQTSLRRATIGIAGCGSIGGASMEVLARMGAERFLLAEPDSFELNNLNRQNATVNDLGSHKADVILQRIQAINPHITAPVLHDGLTPDNMTYFVGSSDVIIDGVDVTSPHAIRMKVALHEEAHRQQKVVICGYDIAGTQLLLTYDYHKGRRKPLNGKFTSTDLSQVTSLVFLSKVVHPLDLPIEMLPVIRAMIAGTQSSIPQLGPTAQLFGVLSAWTVLDVLGGRPVRHKVLVDIPGLLRPRRANWYQAVARVFEIIRLKLYLNRTMKQTRGSRRTADTTGASQ